MSKDPWDNASKRNLELYRAQHRRTLAKLKKQHKAMEEHFEELIEDATRRIDKLKKKKSRKRK